MATGLAIGVTVVGVAAILALFGLLARQFGLWAWALNWVRATKEEKTKLCRQERESSGRSYLDQNNGFEDHQRRERRFFYKLDNDLDWINLWPRSGSYKRFSNLDDVGSDDSQLRINSTIVPDPSIPPQPLRPAPGPPHRMCGREDGGFTNPFSFAGAGMMMDMMMRNHDVMSHRGVDMTRPIPMLDTRDSSRSMNTKFKSSSHQDYSTDILSQPMERTASTNPFRSGSAIDYSMYNRQYPNPFASSYSYPGCSHPFLSTEEENHINHVMPSSSLRTYPSNMVIKEHLYSPKTFENFSRPMSLHGQTYDRTRERMMSHSLDEDLSPKYRFTPDITQSSSQIAYNHSLNQALMKKRALQQTSIPHHNYLNRYDKIKQDEERIREEERILNQLRYENNLIRRERFESSLNSNSPYLTALNSNLYEGEATREIEREAISNNLAYDYQRGASDLREEMKKRMLYDMRTFSSLESRDSPPPPAPDVASSISYSDSAESSPREKFVDWREHLVRNGAEIPATPPNTAALTPPNSASLPPEHRSSLTDPYANSFLQGRLAEIEALRYKEKEGDAVPDVGETATSDQHQNFQENKQISSPQPDSPEAMNYMYHVNTFLDEKDAGGELTQKLPALQEGIGPDVYPKSLKDRIEKRDREGSRRKRKRELERKGSLRQMKETMKISEKPDADVLHPFYNDVLKEYVNPVVNVFTDGKEIESSEKLNSEQENESALKNVPIAIYRESVEETISSQEHIQDKEVVMNEESSQLLSINDHTNRNLGGSPVAPRKSFLSYKGSWNLESNGNEEGQVSENEDDPDRKRVREYIASLSAKLQQLPDTNEGEADPAVKNISLTNSSPECFSSAVTTFPTPPLSAARTNSQSSSDIPSNWAYAQSCKEFAESHNPSISRANSQSLSEVPLNVAENTTFAQSWKSLTESRQNSGENEETQKLPYSETPPSSGSYYPPTPPNSASSHLSETPLSAWYTATPPNSGGLNGSFDLSQAGERGNPVLKRVASCDSVSSDTSVTLGELEDETGQITGYLSVQVIYDCDTQDLEVVVLQARDLVSPDPNTPMDSYVRVFLLPDKSTNMQTRVAKRSNNPCYRERFLFALEEDEALDRALSFYMYATDKFTNTMVGEAQLKLSELDLNSSDPVELVLMDSGQKGVGYGEILFSLSYLPTAERLTIVIVKAKSLIYSGKKNSADPFIKVYILKNGKKIMKKKTTVKKGTDNPVFNEAMIFNVPAPSLHDIQLRVTVVEYNGEHCRPTAVGHVIVGTQATGKPLSHWNQMMTSLRKPIGMWHGLRR